MQLAELLEVPLKHGYKSRLAEWWGVKLSVLTRWIARDSIPKIQIQKAKERGYPGEKWIVIDNIPTEKDLTPYEQIPQHMVPRGQEMGKDSDAGEAGRSDIDRHQPPTLIVPDNDWYIEAAWQILKGKEISVAEALKANIRQFYEQVKDKAHIRQMEKKMWALEKQIEFFKNRLKKGASVPDAE